jgi:hypothetical protein
VKVYPPLSLVPCVLGNCTDREFRMQLQDACLILGYDPLAGITSSTIKVANQILDGSAAFISSMYLLFSISNDKKVGMAIIINRNLLFISRDRSFSMILHRPALSTNL